MIFLAKGRARLTSQSMHRPLSPTHSADCPRPSYYYWGPFTTATPAHKHCTDHERPSMLVLLGLRQPGRPEVEAARLLGRGGTSPVGGWGKRGRREGGEENKVSEQEEREGGRLDAQQQIVAAVQGLAAKGGEGGSWRTAQAGWCGATAAAIDGGASLAPRSARLGLGHLHKRGERSRSHSICMLRSPMCMAPHFLLSPSPHFTNQGPIHCWRCFVVALCPFRGTWGAPRSDEA